MLRPIQVRQLLNYMRTQGFSAGEVLAGSRIDESRLLDQSYLVEPGQCHAVVAKVIQLTANPGVGLLIGGATKLQDIGIVGYGMASSHTLGQAIGLWLQYANSPIGFPFSLQALPQPGAGRWGVWASATGVSDPVFRYYMEASLAMGMRLASVLTGKRLQILNVEFSYPAPPHWRQYERLFKCPIRFDRPVTRAVGRASNLELLIKSNDNELRELCVRHCAQIVRQISRLGTVSARLRSTLTTMGAIPALDAAAVALHMSARSLRRSLQNERTSFQQVLDEFRKDLAQEYLGAGMMQTKEVAHLLGYSQVDAFRRAFKAWTGQTVGEFLAAH